MGLCADMLGNALLEEMYAVSGCKLAVAAMSGVCINFACRVVPVCAGRLVLRLLKCKCAEL